MQRCTGCLVAGTMEEDQASIASSLIASELPAEGRIHANSLGAAAAAAAASAAAHSRTWQRAHAEAAGV